MLIMSTMSHIKLSITVLQEQQNGATNTLGLLTTFRHCWVICGGSWPKVTQLFDMDLGHAGLPWCPPRCECHLSRSRATSTPSTLAMPALPQSAGTPWLLLQTQHTSTPNTDTAAPGWGQTVAPLCSSNYFFFSLRIIFHAIPPGRKV